MKRSLLALFALSVCFLETAALAEEETETKNLGAFVTFGPGVLVNDEASKAVFVGGGGVEGHVAGGLGVVADVAGVWGGSFGGVSVGPLFSFHRSSKTVPFVTGGYTRNFGNGSWKENNLHVGGGVIVWGKRVGCRLEGRFHTSSDPAMWSYTSFRIGAEFR